MTEQKPMTTHDADDARKAYDDAVAKMDNAALRDRVVGVHRHAATNADALKAMVEDYDRLKGEADAAAAGQEQRPA